MARCTTIILSALSSEESLIILLLSLSLSLYYRVSLNHSLNSMDSKNLAICWWPTLLPLHFSDMVMFEQMRPHLEESIQTMIDQYDYIFDNEEPISPQS